VEPAASLTGSRPAARSAVEHLIAGLSTASSRLPHEVPALPTVLRDWPLTSRRSGLFSAIRAHSPRSCLHPFLVPLRARVTHRVLKRRCPCTQLAATASGTIESQSSKHGRRGPQCCKRQAFDPSMCPETGATVSAASLGSNRARRRISRRTGKVGCACCGFLHQRGARACIDATGTIRGEFAPGAPDGDCRRSYEWHRANFKHHSAPSWPNVRALKRTYHPRPRAGGGQSNRESACPSHLPHRRL